jgi:hypothetical protein
MAFYPLPNGINNLGFGDGSDVLIPACLEALLEQEEAKPAPNFLSKR